MNLEAAWTKWCPQVASQSPRADPTSQGLPASPIHQGSIDPWAPLYQISMSTYADPCWTQKIAEVYPHSLAARASSTCPLELAWLCSCPLLYPQYPCDPAHHSLHRLAHTETTSNIWDQFFFDQGALALFRAALALLKIYRGTSIRAMHFLFIIVFGSRCSICR